MNKKVICRTCLADKDCDSCQEIQKIDEATVEIFNKLFGTIVRLFFYIGIRCEIELRIKLIS